MFEVLLVLLYVSKVDFSVLGLVFGVLNRQPLPFQAKMREIFKLIDVDGHLPFESNLFGSSDFE